MGRWEAGETSPEAAQLQSLALDGWDVHYILTGEREQRPGTGGELAGDERWVLGAWRGLSERQRAAWRTLLEDLGPAPLDERPCAEEPPSDDGRPPPSPEQ